MAKNPKEKSAPKAVPPTKKPTAKDSAGKEAAAKLPPAREAAAGMRPAKDASPKEPLPSLVLEYIDATLGTSDQRYGFLRAVSFQLRERQLALVLDVPDRRLHLLADSAVGLLAPSVGRVCFDQTDWQALAYEEMLLRRSQIGRVFSGGAWIGNLTVLENVLLAPRHHSKTPDKEILQRANATARRLGFESIPRNRPANVAAPNLRKCQWIRAIFMDPKLLILEEPLAGIPASDHESLLQAEWRHRQRGGATLWITNDRRSWERAFEGDVSRYRVAQERLELVEGAVA